MSVAFWNAQRLLIPKRAAGGERPEKMKEGAAWRKLDWLADVLKEERPSVIGIMEVDGAREEASALRKWFRAHKYFIRFLVGEMASATVEGGRAQGGVLLAVAAEQAEFVEYSHPHGQARRGPGHAGDAD